MRWEQRGGPNPQMKAFTVVGEVFGQCVFPATKLGADGFPPHRDGAAGGVPGKAATRDMELCRGTWHGSAVPWDPLLVLRGHGTWVQIMSQNRVSGARCSLFSSFRMGKGPIWWLK